MLRLLRKTPSFYNDVTKNRLKTQFNRAYRYAEVLFDGRNPYLDAIRSNMEHLQRILKQKDWSLLRRNPNCYVGVEDAVHDVENLVGSQLAALRDTVVKPDPSLLMPV